MRARVAATVALALLATGASASPAAAVDRDRVRDAVTAAGFPELADPAAAAAGPSMRLELRRLRSRPPLGTSRLGGSPDLPRGTAWPTCRGRPQSFLGQIRLRDLPAAGRALRRHGGRLLLFTHVELEVPNDDYGLWAADCSRVLRVPAGRPSRRVAPPRGTLRLRRHAVRPVAVTDVPDTYDGDLLAPMLGLPFDWDRWEPWHRMRIGLQGMRAGRDDEVRSRLLGYPDAPNGTDECFDRSQRSRGAWRLLAAINPYEGLGFEVGDGGNVQFLISPADLRAGRFDRVCGRDDSA